MNDENARGIGRFQTTRWSLIARSRDTDPELRRKALGELFQRYCPALRAHLLLRQRINPDRAEDLLQGFFSEKILEGDLLAQVDPARGRFRSLLVRALDNYAVDQARRDLARKQAPGQEVSLESDEVAAEQTISSDVFDVAWAREVIAESVRRMEAECRQRNRTRIWEVFEQRILVPTFSHALPPRYDELVRRFGFASPEQASNALMTAKRQFKRTLESVVAEYTEREEEIEDEIRELRQTLSVAGPLDLPVAYGRSSGTDAQTAESLAAIDETGPQDLAAMLEVRDERDSLWDPEELGHLLRHQLSQPLDAFLKNIDGIPSPTLAPQLSTEDAPLVTLSDLFRHPKPPLELLQAVKRVARSSVKVEVTAVPVDISSVLYFAAIAAALVHHGTRITKSGDDVLRYGLQVMLERAWLDDDTRRLLRDAIGGESVWE